MVCIGPVIAGCPEAPDAKMRQRPLISINLPNVSLHAMGRGVLPLLMAPADLTAKRLPFEESVGCVLPAIPVFVSKAAHG